MTLFLYVWPLVQVQVQVHLCCVFYMYSMYHCWSCSPVKHLWDSRSLLLCVCFLTVMKPLNLLSVLLHVWTRVFLLLLVFRNILVTSCWVTWFGVSYSSVGSDCMLLEVLRKQQPADTPCATKPSYKQWVSANNVVCSIVWRFIFLMQSVKMQLVSVDDQKLRKCSSRGECLI